MDYTNFKDSFIKNKFDFTEDELYAAAIKNLEAGGRNAAITGTISCLFDMPSITTKGFYHGSSAVFVPSILSRMEIHYGGSFCLIPSSIHEWLVFPYNGRYSRDYLDIVLEANRTSVLVNERLSNNVYWYNSDSKKVEILFESDEPLVAESEE